MKIAGISIIVFILAPSISAWLTDDTFPVGGALLIIVIGWSVYRGSRIAALWGMLLSLLYALGGVAVSVTTAITGIREVGLWRLVPTVAEPGAPTSGPQPDSRHNRAR